jgi:acyl-[acyl-carrier-protein]-phospholipid O-acyltransferase/long-chain-fatty-acid--[acyl-carrier-protein] ligase
VAEATPAVMRAWAAGLWVDWPVWGGVVLAVGLAVLLAFACWPGGLWLLGHSLYRLRVRGRNLVPARGAALLVCNQVSGLDWLLLLAAVPRPIRLVLCTAPNTSRARRFLFRWFGVLTIDSSAGPRAVAQVLRQAREALTRGELVGIFTETRVLPNGLRLPFHRVFARVSRGVQARSNGAAVPVVPVWLQAIWGSLSVRGAGGRPFVKWPLVLPYPVEVHFGEPLQPGSSAGEARQAVQELSARASVARSGQRRPVHRQFVRMAARHPFRLCMLDSSMPDRRLSYSRTLAGVLCMARLLRPRLGDTPLVAVWLPPSMGGAITNIALAMLGKTSVNLNYTASADSIRSALRQCGSRHVITSQRFLERMKLEVGPDVELICLEDLGPLVTNWMRWTRWLAVVLLPGWFLERFVLRLGRHRLDDLATVIFSSGSTGEPKGVMLSHGNIACNVESMIQTIALAARDRALGVLPLFHSFGYTVTLWTPLQVGASVVYHPDPRQAKEIGELCKTHRCTIYLSTATFLRFCLRKCEPDSFASLRLLICGAEKLPPSLAADFEKKFGVLPLEGYGCTELSPVTATNLSDVVEGGGVQVNNRPGTVGQPIPGVAARIVHPETRALLRTGEEGLLLIYGGNVMQGYLGRPDLTRQVLADGWYVTGDMARQDADGYITLTGRLSRFAKCGGEMVPLEKVEEVLHDILGTSERICVVTCVPDDSRGERLVVLYIERDGLAVRDWCQQLNRRGLPNLWVPSERDFFAVAELPLLGSGKLNLQGVKEMALGLAKK